MTSNRPPRRSQPIRVPVAARDGVRPRSRLVVGRIGVACVLIVVLTAGSCSNTGSSVSGSTSLGDKVCSILRSDLAPKAAEGILSVLTHGEFEGGLAWNLTVKIVQLNCDSLLSAALGIVRYFFGNRPQDTRVAAVSTFESNLPSILEEASIASDLSPMVPNSFAVNIASVRQLVGELCADLRGARPSDPATDVGNLVGRADLRALAAVNELISRVLRTCPSLSGLQADTLVLSLTSFLAANQRLEQDVTPPAVLGPTWSRTGVDSIQLRWAALDDSGVASYDLWVRLGQVWSPLLSATTESSTNVAKVFASQDYVFALRARDVVGNQSGWVYLVPCLTCP
jgi:hypothetical protein